MEADHIPGNGVSRAVSQERDPPDAPHVASALHALHLYGSAGIASFGWALCKMLGFDGARLIPLWFAAGIFVYNLDRLKSDPSDATNTPVRTHRLASLRRISIAATALAATALVVLPILWRDWTMLALTLTGGVICSNYSVPVCGWRLKDLPLVKTALPPTVVTLACLVPPLLTNPARDIQTLSLAAAWAWCFLMFNMTACDLRDIVGDRAHGIRSLPVCLGRNGTQLLLNAFAICAVSLAFILHAPLLATACAFCLGLLAFALRRPRSEAFYDWWVEGLLFLPALTMICGENR